MGTKERPKGRKKVIAKKEKRREASQSPGGGGGRWGWGGKGGGEYHMKRKGFEKEKEALFAMGRRKGRRAGVG